MHLHFPNKLPPLLSNIFVKTSKTSTLLTRSSYPSNNLSLCIPGFQTARFKDPLNIKVSRFGMQFPQIFKQKLKGYSKLNLRNIFWVTTTKLSVTTFCDFSSLKFSGSNYLILRMWLLAFKTERSIRGYPCCLCVCVHLEY